MNILIVDDEPLARARLHTLIDDLGEPYCVVAEAANGEQALAECRHESVDLVLMDIRMPGMDGLDAAAELAKAADSPAVVFVTAYDEHALAAFEREAIDYLLKPVRKERLQQALQKAQTLTRPQKRVLDEALLSSSPGRTHLHASYMDEVKTVPVDDVLYFRADQKYVSVRYSEGELLLEESLKSLETEFGDRFLRIHRNALVNKTCVEGMVREAENNWCLRLRGVPESLEISRRHLAVVRKWLKQRS